MDHCIDNDNHLCSLSYDSQFYDLVEEDEDYLDLNDIPDEDFDYYRHLDMLTAVIDSNLEFDHMTELEASFFEHDLISLDVYLYFRDSILQLWFENPKVRVAS